MTKKVKRLYQQFIPATYALDITPSKPEMTFQGVVTIKGKKVGRPSQRLTFHQKGLKITEATLTKHTKTGDQALAIDRINAHNTFDEVRLHSGTMLYAGEYTIKLRFSGKITKPMNGLYPCNFEHNGKQQILLATQFESHHAREVFPCIDEPEAKATFQLSLTHPANETALSNTPVETQAKLTSSQLATKFETTPIMSTYLLAFVIGNLDFKEAKTKHGTKVRTYATPDNVKFTDYSLEIAVKVLDFYDEYFGIFYPLEKCDMVALPDFASGAMENWGCITYREQVMLVDPKNSTLAAKQYVAMVVAHELAHQWFGNLVTMRWWTDLWLNEGFASWIEYMAVDHLYPEWEMWTQFIVDEQQRALKLDALENTHPIEVTVNHPDEIRTIFDEISYSKGASIIHMLHEYLGPELFKKGLHHYLRSHAYGNTNTIDLWQALEEVSQKPVKEFMHAWTALSGFPIVSACVDENQIKVTQERFYINPSHADQPKSVWPVPLHSNILSTDTLTEKSKIFPGPSANLVKLNTGQSGFYRTTYSSSHLNSLGELIRRSKIDATDRLGILSDLFEAAKAGQATTTDALHFLENFKFEDNYAVWDVISGAIGSVRVVMDDEGLREDMKPYLRTLVATQLKRLGWQAAPDESHFDSLLRPIIISLAAVADDPKTIEKALALFNKVKVKIDIDPDLRGVVFSTAARLGGRKEFSKILALHNKSTLSEERNMLAAALTGFKQPELIKQSLDMIQTDSVRLQDVGYWLAFSFMNRHAKKQTWDWMKINWGWLEKNLGSDMSFSRMPIYAARVFSQADFITDYQKFFTPILTIGLERSYKQGLEMIQWQSAWKERDLKAIKTFFKTKQ